MTHSFRDWLVAQISRAPVHSEYLLALEHALAEYDKFLEAAPTVKGRKSIGGRYMLWAERWEYGRDEISHSARLVDIRPIGEEK